MSSNSENTALEKRLSQELSAFRARYNRFENFWRSFLSEVRVCVLAFSDDLFLLDSYRNRPVLGPLPIGAPAEEVLATPAAAAYFGALRSIRTEMLDSACGADGRPWTRVYSTGSGGRGGFAGWVEHRPGLWNIGDDAVATRKDVAKLAECYLGYPEELVGPDDDFRVEYTARAESDPCDLSLVVGGNPGGDVYAGRPDYSGYSFCFGAYDNSCSELQRACMPMVQTQKAQIVPGMDHRCAAERVGGMLRFFVDGTHTLSCLDFVPVMGKGSGYVSLYACAPCETFSDVSVFTRPTCLSREVRERAWRARRTILAVPSGPAGFVEMSLLGRYAREFTETSDILFAAKDVTEIMEQSEKMGKDRRHAEKTEALLHLARAAAHELSQPLTVIMSYLDIIAARDPHLGSATVVRKELETLKESARRISGIVEKMGEIERYKVKPYIDGHDVLDIDASSGRGPGGR